MEKVDPIRPSAVSGKSLLRFWPLPVMALWALEAWRLWLLPAGPGPKTLLALAELYFLFAMVAIAALDWRLRIIPAALVVPGTALGLAAAWAAPAVHPAGGLTPAVFGVIMGAGIAVLLRAAGTVLFRHRLAAIRRAEPGVDAALGWGDVMLMGYLGSLLGPAGGVRALGLGAVLGAGIGLVRRWRVVPFGLFLCLAGVCIFMAKAIMFR